MSMHDVLRSLVMDGRIAHVPPVMRQVSMVRTLFLEVSIGDRLRSSLSGSTREDVRLAGLYGDLDRFVSGKLITVGDDPFEKEKTAFMARTSPVQDGIFDIRSQDPKPAIRLFGAFCDKDTFIGLTWRFRKELGGKDERLFDQAVLNALGVWKILFPDHLLPVYSTDMGGYFSGNFLVV